MKETNSLKTFFFFNLDSFVNNFADLLKLVFFMEEPFQKKEKLLYRHCVCH